MKVQDTKKLYIYLIATVLIYIALTGNNCEETFTRGYISKSPSCMILQGFPKDDTTEQMLYEPIPWVNHSVSSTATLSDVAMGRISDLIKV